MIRTDQKRNKPMKLEWSLMERKDTDFASLNGYRLMAFPNGRWQIEKPEGRIIKQGKEKSEKQAKIKIENNLRSLFKTRVLVSHAAKSV